VGLEASIQKYLHLGAPAPEGDGPTPTSSVALDIDWSGAWEAVPEDGPEDEPA
jgi:hypothetical protein